MNTTAFQEWIDAIFNIPVEDIPHYYDDDWQKWYKGTLPVVTFDFMVRLFEQADALLAPFTDKQHLWGLYYIAAKSPAKSEYLLLDEPYRQRCIDSLYQLFKGFFLVRCWPDPFDMEGRKSVNIACMRWWWTIPFGATPEDPVYNQIDHQFIEIMARILDLNSEACRESALYGLGIWAFGYPKEVKAIVSAFLDQAPPLRREINTLASRARDGFELTAQVKEAMIQDIEDAFADTTYPGDDNIAKQDHCGECAEIAEAFKGKTWQELLDVKFLRYHSAALSLFKPPAFRYYLPAFMRAVLLDAETADVIQGSLFFHLTPPDPDSSEAQKWLESYGQSRTDYFLDFVSGFTKQQKSMIKRYLETLARVGVFIDSETESENRHLVEFWNTFED